MSERTKGHNKLFLLFKEKVDEPLESSQLPWAWETWTSFHSTDKMESEFKMAILRPKSCSLYYVNEKVTFQDILTS